MTSRHALFFTTFVTTLTVTGCADLSTGHSGTSHRATTASTHPVPSTPHPAPSTSPSAAPSISPPAKPIHNPPTIRPIEPEPVVATASVVDNAAPIAINDERASTRDDLTIPPPAQPDDGFHYVGRLGIAFGGDLLTNVPFDDGSTGGVRAGTGEQFSFGAGYNFAGPLALEVTIGFINDQTFLQDQSAGFYRYPLEAIGYWRLNSFWRVGGGIQHLFLSTVQGAPSSTASTGPIRFNNTNGAIYELELTVNKNASLALRCVTERLTANSFTGSLSGNQYGLFGTIRFH